MYWTKETNSRAIPEAGDEWVYLTREGEDRKSVVHRMLRESDCMGVFTVVDLYRNLRWIRWDAARRMFVRAYGQPDGAPITAPTIHPVGEDTFA